VTFADDPDRIMHFAGNAQQQQPRITREIEVS